MSNFFTKYQRRIQSRFQLSLRTKLLLFALTFLVIPWIGYQYVNAMESYLRKAQADALLAMTQAVSTVLNERIDLFQKQADILQTVKNTNHIYVRPLKSAIVLDGYADDWKDYDTFFKYYGKENIIESNTSYDKNKFNFTHAVGRFRRFLYIIFKVKDDKIIYRSPNSLSVVHNDHLQIGIQSPKGDFSRFTLASTAPGWVNAYRMPEEGSDNPPTPVVRIKGEWQETKYGYIIEIRIPLSMVGNKIAFAIADVDDKKTRAIKNIIGTGGTRKIEELGTVMVPSPEMEKLLKGLERKSTGTQADYSATRTWVIDKNRRVIARAGTLKPPARPIKEDNAPFLSRFMRSIYKLILKQPSSQFKDELSGASKLQGNEIETALKGAAGTNRRRTPDNQVDILSAAFPVWDNKKIIGAVVMEQTSNSILLLQNKAMENLFNISFFVFVIATLILLVFATHISGRVRRLRDDAENAIGLDGRVKNQITGSNAGDEIGDLSRSVSGMLERLGHYNRYLETMASKLSHELRTPLTVVKSSLDNLEMQKLDKDALTYTNRAREGVDRLSNILTRMSEASRLEQSLLNMERETFDIDKVISGCVEGYKLAYTEKSLELVTENADFSINGVPDLIAQMLDKLVSNAMDFCQPDSTIKIGLFKHLEDIFITVSNEGPQLPTEMQGNLFDSMVSVRRKKGDKLHLGLGLYIVRVIVDFHQGMVSACNLANPDGVEFTIMIPQNFDGKKSGVFGVP